MKKTLPSAFAFMMIAPATFAATPWDANQDGWILFDEFIRFYEKDFLTKDADGDRFLSKTEFQNNQFDDIDFNNDGKVDSIEYCNAQAYVYHVMDKNEDNRVSEEEAAWKVKIKNFYYAVDDRESHYTVTGDTDPENIFRSVWEIGKQDSSSAEFALAPDQYEEFLKEDGGGPQSLDSKWGCLRCSGPRDPS
jgi:hypothetical protein